MKGFWKKLHRKTAVMLVASMLATSILPVTGLAKSYDLNGILGDDTGFDTSAYKATASVAALADGSRLIQLADGVGTGETEIHVQYDIQISQLATASDAVATSADWQTEAKEGIEEEILKHLTMKATLSNADLEIRDYIALDTDNMFTNSTVTVGVDIPAEQLPSLTGGSYEFSVKFEPESDGDLGEDIVVNLLSSKTFTGNVTVGTEAATVTLRGFHSDDQDGETWIYNTDEPVDLKDYCTTEPAGLPVTFTSGNPDVATISDAGVFSPVPGAKGTTTVTAKVDGAGEDTMDVHVWDAEQMPDAPAAFELYEEEKWEFTFTDRLSKANTCILDMDGNEVGEETVKVKVSGDSKIVTVTSWRAGEYQLRLIRHDGANLVTYYAFVDFTVKPLQDGADFHISGFNEGEEDDLNGVTSTWVYLDQGGESGVYLPSYCRTELPGAEYTFTSSEPSVATVDGAHLKLAGKGKTTVTATMKAPGYRPVSDTLIVDVWETVVLDNLPESITLHERDSWKRTFAEPLRRRTKFFVIDANGEDAKDFVKVSVSEDLKTVTMEAKKAGEYELYYRCHEEDTYTTYGERVYITVLEKGVSLNIPVNQVVVEPGKSVSFDVAFSPEDAELTFGDDYDRTLITPEYKDGKVTVTALESAENGETGLELQLSKDGKLLAQTWIKVYVAEKQLEAATTEEALSEANTKVTEAITNGNMAEVHKIVSEVVEILAASSQSEVSANKDAIDELEAALADVASVGNDVYDEDTEVEVSGAILNLMAMGETDGKMVVEPVEDEANRNGVTLDIKLQRGSNGESITELSVPMQIRIKVSGIDLTKNIRIKHTKENGSVEWIYPEVDGEYLVFWVDSYSEFAISNYTTGGSSGGGGGGGGGSSVSTSAAGTVSSDAKKGYVNSVTGIITGSQAGYSNWKQDESGWKLQYADGTFAAGAMLTDANGNAYEQVAWELINGAWYPFGADGYVKSGLVYDVALGGTFYVDINAGMKTGWQVVDGAWRYFNTVSDGRRGIMLTDTTVDGYYIDAEGIWRG